MKGVLVLVCLASLFASFHPAASTGEWTVQVPPLTTVLCSYALTGFQFVTCGSALKLASVENNVRLHSHDVKYGSGSGQQVASNISSQATVLALSVFD